MIYNFITTFPSKLVKLIYKRIPIPNHKPIPFVKNVKLTIMQKMLMRMGSWSEVVLECSATKNQHISHAP